MTEVIFDSSFLMAVVESPTTWFEDLVEAVGKFQPVLLDCVREELSKIASGEGRRSRTARVALGLASGFKALPCGQGGVDDEIVSASASRRAFVATVDSELLRSARASHLNVIYLKKGRVAFP